MKIKEKEVDSLDWEKLYEAHFMKVYSYTMTIVKNQDMAEEITQQAFFKAMRQKKDTFAGNASEVTWLCTIAKNLAMDEFRKKKRVDEEIEERASSERLEEKLIDKEMSFRIHQILHELAEPYKEVFQLRVFGELSFLQIAEIFGKSESWARVTYHRARAKIQERMNDSL